MIHHLRGGDQPLRALQELRLHHHRRPSHLTLLWCHVVRVIGEAPIRPHHRIIMTHENGLMIGNLGRIRNRHLTDARRRKRL